MFKRKLTRIFPILIITCMVPASCVQMYTIYEFWNSMDCLKLARFHLIRAPCIDPAICTCTSTTLKMRVSVQAIHQDKYRIVGNFRWRKPSQINRKWPFRRENFHAMLKPIIGWYSTPKFRRENFRGWFQNHKIRECFLLWKFCTIQYGVD